jgi:hypothetical protein
MLSIDALILAADEPAHDPLSCHYVRGVLELIPSTDIYEINGPTLA